jgi:hypothetical protein
VVGGGREVVGEEPLREEVRIGEGAPDFFWRVGEGFLEDDGLGIGFGHGFILSRRNSSWLRRCCQKAL